MAKYYKKAVDGFHTNYFVSLSYTSVFVANGKVIKVQKPMSAPIHLGKDESSLIKIMEAQDESSVILTSAFVRNNKFKKGTVGVKQYFVGLGYVDDVIDDIGELRKLHSGESLSYRFDYLLEDLNKDLLGGRFDYRGKHPQWLKSLDYHIIGTSNVENDYFKSDDHIHCESAIKIK